MRIGQGYDVHRLTEGRDLILGGVKIPYDKGLLGHSDADVLVHAVMDALLGAAALGDIGEHFPDTDPRYKDMDSMKILAKIYEMMKEKKYHIGNVDATILAEKPKMAPYIQQMRQNISDCLHCSMDQISIKATRGEKMGFVGKEEGMVAMSICLLEEECAS